MQLKCSREVWLSTLIISFADSIMEYLCSSLDLFVTLCRILKNLLIILMALKIPGSFLTWLLALFRWENLRNLCMSRSKKERIVRKRKLIWKRRYKRNLKRGYSAKAVNYPWSRNRQVNKVSKEWPIQSLSSTRKALITKNTKATKVQSITYGRFRCVTRLLIYMEMTCWFFLTLLNWRACVSIDLDVLFNQ